MYTLIKNPTLYEINELVMFSESYKILTKIIDKTLKNYEKEKRESLVDDSKYIDDDIDMGIFKSKFYEVNIETEKSIKKINKNFKKSDEQFFNDMVEYDFTNGFPENFFIYLKGIFYTFKLNKDDYNSTIDYYSGRMYYESYYNNKKIISRFFGEFIFYTNNLVVIENFSNLDEDEDSSTTDLYHINISKFPVKPDTIMECLC